jgi:hypothetical protein
VVAFFGLLFVPGASNLALCGVRVQDGAARLGMALGLGAAVLPLAWLWLDLARVPVGALSVVGLVALGAGAAAATARVRARPRVNALARLRGRPDPGLVALVVIVAAALSVRWWSVRSLDLPRWGDSVHHTVIVDLMLRARGLPETWQPYADLGSFSYHFGFHALAATLAGLARLEAHEAVIAAGQLLMVAGILTAYALGSVLSGRRWVGVGAALAAGGLSSMPAYYVNWGRYTQLAGQVILPAAAAGLVLAARGLRRARGGEEGTVRPAGGSILVAAVLLAGLALTHYVVALFLLLFAVAWLAVGDGPDARVAHSSPASGDADASGPHAQMERIRARRTDALVTCALAGVSGFLLAIPWLPRFLAGPIDGYALSLSTTRPADPAVFGVNPPAEIWSHAGLFVGFPLVAAFAGGTAIALVRRRRAGITSALWVGLLIVATHPALLGLPVSGVLKSFTVAIGLYLAAGPAVGVVVDAAAERRERATLLACCAAALVASWGGRTGPGEDTRLVTSNDRAALEWVAANTPPGSVFLVSAFPAFGGTAVAGDDAGWWLPYLTGRGATVPPITYVLETPSRPGYREAVNDLVSLWHADLDGAQTVRALDAAGVTHAFVGETARTLDDAGTGQGLASKLAASRSWRLLHESGRAQVWERLP